MTGKQKNINHGINIGLETFFIDRLTPDKKACNVINTVLKENQAPAIINQLKNWEHDLEITNIDWNNIFIQTIKLYKPQRFSMYNLNVY